MPEGQTPILSVPFRQVDRHRVAQVDEDRIRGREIAGPLFDAGCIKVAIAELPDYHGSLHTENTHWLHLVVQGRMRFRLGRQTIIAEAGDLVCQPAGLLGRRTGLGPIVWIQIELKDIPAWAPLKTIGPRVRRYESADLMYILMKRITGAVRSQDVYSIRCSFESSQMLVTLLKRELQQSSNEWTSGRMGRLVGLLDRIRENPRKEWTRSAMARHVKMSERNLSRVFQRAFNMPPSKMVMTIRMDLASRMLATTDKSLADIADAVGYESTFSFSRLFRKYVGISPGAYRDLPEGERGRVAAATELSVPAQ